MFKYQGNVTGLEGCPPVDWLPRRQVAFRFTFANNMGMSFIPPAILDPDRGFADDARCRAYCLSFYTTEDKAVSAFERLQTSVPLIRKKIGDSLASGELLEDDGVASPVAGTGHFELLEEEGSDFVSKFKIVREL